MILFTMSSAQVLKYGKRAEYSVCTCLHCHVLL